MDKTTSLPSTPPKLSYSLPSPRPEPFGTLTPPLRPKVSVPFQWEEIPGKPINNLSHTTDIIRKLELPPRLSAGTTPSPTTVFEGPEPISLRSCYSFSLAEFGSFRSYSMRTNGKKKQHGFWSWNSRRKNGSNKARKAGTSNCDAGWGLNYLDGLDLAVKGYSGSLSSSARFSSTVKHCEVRISRPRDRSHAASHLWENIYGSLKHVVIWRKDRKAV